MPTSDPIFKLLRFPVFESLPFTIDRGTGVMEMNPLLAKLLGLSSSTFPDAGESLINLFLDPCDRILCRESFQKLLDNQSITCSHYARVSIYGKVFWIRLTAKPLSSHASSRMIEGSVVIYNFQEILSELLQQLDCSVRDRETLEHFQRVLPLCQTALIEFSELYCEPDKLCLAIPEEIRSSIPVFAEPLFDGGILVAFSCTNDQPMTNLDVFSKFGKVDVNRSFISPKTDSVLEATDCRAEFLIKLSEHIPVKSGLTLAEMVHLAQAFRRDFIGLTQVFQPQVDKNGFIGGEFLVRLADRSVSPEVFIPVLEKTTLIQPFGRWVVEYVLHQARFLEPDMKPGFKVSFNLSACQSSDIGFVPFVKLCLKRFIISPRHLMVELTETARPSNRDFLHEQIKSLRELGVLTAVDDFGTGYNSLEVLLQVPFDMVKFSRNFVLSVLEDSDKQRFFAKIISACHDIGLSVCAEGVEDAEMHRLLADMGVDVFQGYCYAKPLPIQEAVRAVKQCPYVQSLKASS